MEESGRSRGGALLGAEGLLAAALVLAPLALGTVHTGPLVVVAALVAGAALLAAFARPRPVPWPVWAAAACALYVAFQCVPLPRGLLRLLSPHAVELLEFSIGPIDAHAISLDTPATALALARLSTFALALFTASRLGSDPRAGRRLALVVAAMALSQCLLVIGHKVVATDAIYGMFPTTQGNAVLGSFGNANHFSGYLTLGIPLLLALGLGSRQEGDRIAWLVAGAVGAVVVILTGSRSGILGLAAALCLLLVLLRARLAEVRRPLIGVGAGFAVVALGAVYLDSARIVSKFAALLHPARIGGDIKVRAWRDVPALIGDYFATGIGRGAFETVFPGYKRVPEALTFSHVENAPLQLMADLGVPVALAVMAAWLAAIALAGRRERAALAEEDGALRLGAVAALLGISVHELGDFSLDISGAVGLTAAVLFGLLWPAQRASRRAPTAEPPGWRARPEPRVAVVGLFVLAGGAGLGWSIGRNLTRDVAEVKAAAAIPGASIEPLVRDAIARHPGEPWFAFMGAVDRLRHHQPQAALPYLNRALLLDPTAWPPHQALSEALYALGQRDQALLEMRLAYAGSDYSDAVAIALLAHPDFQLPLVFDRFAEGDAEALGHLAAYLDRAHKDDAAAAAATRLLLVRPGDVETERLLARVEVRRHHLESALQHARALPHGDAEALLIEVQSLDGLGRAAESDALLTIADKLGSTAPLAAPTGMLLAERALARKHPAAALGALDRIAQDGLDPETVARIMLLRSSAFEASGRTRESLLEAEHAARVDPCETTWLALGATYERVGLLREALLVYRGAVRSTPKPSDELRDRLKKIERAMSAPTIDGSGGGPTAPSLTGTPAGEADPEGEGEAEQ